MRGVIPKGLFITPAVLLACGVVAFGAPSPPTLTAPIQDTTLGPEPIYIEFSGEPHSKYEIRLSMSNYPGQEYPRYLAENVVAFSDQVPSTANWGYVELPEYLLRRRATFYVFVRIADSSGWSGWSAGGRRFRFDPSCQPPNQYLRSSPPTPTVNRVRLQGQSLADNNGPFLGIGASYFLAMWKCRNDRGDQGSNPEAGTYRGDLKYLKNKGINVIRILSMVGTDSVWYGKEIAPVAFKNGTRTVPKWDDYWTVFERAIDIAYDEYGIRTEVTVFADADLMADDAARYSHMSEMVTHLTGREHKVVMLEVANEHWRNDVSAEKLRSYGQYLAARTNVLVALSTAQPVGADKLDQDIKDLYLPLVPGVDLATVHFYRLASGEGGWRPVRDSWRPTSGANPPLLPIPLISNEPAGPGASTDGNERDVTRLGMAAAFAWGAGCPMYVFHSRAGVGVPRNPDDPRADLEFPNMAGLKDDVFVALKALLPADFASWTRSNGTSSDDPFTSYAGYQNGNGQWVTTANNWTTECTECTRGANRHISKTRGLEFITVAIGIPAGGLPLSTNKRVRYSVYSLVDSNGQVNVAGAPYLGPVTRNANASFLLPQPTGGACIIKGEVIPDIEPGAATAPGPANALSPTVNPGTVTLSWTPGIRTKSMTLDFGTTNPPPTLATGMTSPTFAPGTLAPGTVYYWRVACVNIAGTTAGPVWRFKTSPGAPAPTKAEIVIPINGDTDVSVTRRLRWEKQDQATVDLYFGPNPEPPIVMQNSNVTTFLPERLLPSTTYYWRVDTFMNGQTTAGDLWHFATAAPLPAANPFGAFESPLPNDTVSSAIPVTGWALDNHEVRDVKIYRMVGSNEVFIGNAIFTEGARPDVDQSYPSYPYSAEAGWGYMLLTNSLPGCGNGTFTLRAKASDIHGHTVVLGTAPGALTDRTIHVDNARATKPFGALDAPAPGATVSGTITVNGWALTPPGDGSCQVSQDIGARGARLFIDETERAVMLPGAGRADVAAQFNNTNPDPSGCLYPVYLNLDHAGFSVTLDTATLNNGLHTIYMYVTDSCGHTDGIGSRPFRVQNY